ncbi:hypothetical protein DFJ74DRAFT_144604, partial [Hyaloraphidium curvatum]
GGSAAAGPGWRTSHVVDSGFGPPPPAPFAPTTWLPSRPAEPDTRTPWREWYADYLARGGTPARNGSAPAGHRQALVPEPSPPRTAARPHVQGEPTPVRQPLASAPIQSPAAPPSSSSSDFGSLLAAVEQRTAPPQTLAERDESFSESSSEPLSAPLSPPTDPVPVPPLPHSASPWDALIPPYAVRMPPPDPALLVPRGQSVKKRVIEKRRREAFAAELRALAAAVPGAAAATQACIVLRARDYIVRLARREKLLRRMVLEKKAERMGLDVSDPSTVKSLLADLESELEREP